MIVIKSHILFDSQAGIWVGCPIKYDGSACKKALDSCKQCRVYVPSLIPPLCTRYKTTVDMISNREAIIVVVCDV